MATFLRQIESIGRFERQRQPLLGLQLERAFAGGRVDGAGVERIELVERGLTVRLLRERPCVAAGLASTWYSNQARSRP